ncbi:AraC family transcriptional regulator [Xanthovirga aplysinae]|uniref:AraC family transcriptional regulator n=1 Tax=Xanthovirga aplysinae TaxID=2529853 RepID=UPI0012BD06FC|nr:helix-turn-helix transcriptional regulator [Xanthovirga aplysinae]MTI30156.1 AraC family transcriptional regulator [Xanthovirga aplysinae]
MKEIEIYDLHKEDHFNLHFEIHDAASYYSKNKEKASVPHRHSFYQVIWFRKAGRHYIDYQLIEHSENTVFFINKNQIHYFCPDASNEGYLYHFNDSFINNYAPDLMERFSISIFSEINRNYVMLSDGEAVKLGAIASFLTSELDTKDFFYRETVFHLFQTVLFLIERLRKKQGLVNLDTDSDYSLAVAFKKLIFKRINEFYPIDSYAEELNTNSKTLTRISKEYLLDTPANIIKQSKILEAKRMLSNQKITISGIAYTLGFDQPTYFTKYFKKETGLTPKEFQNSIL